LGAVLETGAGTWALMGEGDSAWAVVEAGARVVVGAGDREFVEAGARVEAGMGA